GLCAGFRLGAEKHLSRLRVSGHKGTSLCPVHLENTPSFSVDFEKGVFHCFGCGKGGGVKAFAELVGEPWGNIHGKSHAARTRFAVQARRRQAEAQARAILQRRADERDKALCTAYREAHATVAGCAGLLALFHRRPDLAEEFSDVVKLTERDYADALFQCSLLEAQRDGELEVGE